jgi:gamma-glutamyltranspeptidase/glutathione hydrolase
MVAGIFAIHQQLGRLPFKVLIEPAVAYARQGFVVNEFNAFTYQLLEPILRRESEAEAFYAPQGQLLTPGCIARLPQFAEVLEQLARYGCQWFYQGELAHLALASLQNGGALTAADWSDYAVNCRRPLQVPYRQYQILTNPPPSSGGILIAFALKLLEAFHLEHYPLGSPAQVELFSRIMATTNQARHQNLDGFLHQSGIEQQFLNHIPGGECSERPPLNKLGSTTHISILDGEGNAASLTSSNGEGSGHLIPDTGIMLNNMLGEADLNPRGFYQWQPRQRLSSMMAPSLVLTQGHPKLVLGSGGSNRIRSAILQVICHCLDYHLPLPAAVAHSRLHWEAQKLDLEPSSWPDIPAKLHFDDQTQISLWTEQNMFFGGVHGVEYRADGQLQGVGDPRRSGAVEYSC